MTLFILDINYYKKQGITYIVFSILTMIFGIVYECFSHNVFSYFMMYAFLIPLICGGVLSFIIYTGILKCGIRISNNLYNAGIATLTIGSIIKGVLEIYGTTNVKVYLYVIVGFGLLLLSGGLYISKKLFINE